MMMKKFNYYIYMLEIDILRNASQIFLGGLRGAFEGFGGPKRHPDTLLAKPMVLCTTEHLSVRPEMARLAGVTQAGSQPGFRNWVSKIGNYKILGHPFFFQGRTQYIEITTMLSIY